MADTKQTRCPHCSIAFYVTNAQVAAAEGTVRCGICLSLFDANENLLEPGGRTEINPVADEPVTDTGPDAVQADPEVVSHEPESSEAESSEAGSEASVDLLGSGSDFEQGESPGATAPGGTGSSTTEIVLSDDVASEELEEFGEGQRPFHLRQLDILSEAMPDKPPAFSESDSTKEPSEKTESSLIKRWVMLFMLVVGILAVSGQLLFYTSAQLSLKPHYRPALVALCGWLACPIAEQRKLSLIYSDALVIQSHPELWDALQVDVVLTNGAAFAQVFPGLLLQFKDLSGTVLAQRVFRPKQYLSGTLAGLATMQPQQGYRIRLELLGQNASAVSYSLTIVE